MHVIIKRKKRNKEGRSDNNGRHVRVCGFFLLSEAVTMYSTINKCKKNYSKMDVKKFKHTLINNL